MVELSFRFKVLYVRQRSILLRHLLTRTHFALVALDNGALIYVSVFSPTDTGMDVWIDDVALQLKKELSKDYAQNWVLQIHKKRRWESTLQCLERTRTLKKSYELAGREGEVKLNV